MIKGERATKLQFVNDIIVRLEANNNADINEIGTFEVILQQINKPKEPIIGVKIPKEILNILSKYLLTMKLPR